MYKSYSENNFASKKESLSNTRIKWTPPAENGVKLNFDDSVLSKDNAAAGFIIRNS